LIRGLPTSLAVGKTAGGEEEGAELRLESSGREDRRAFERVGKDPGLLRNLSSN
jgi:hypothetical protein